MGVVLTAVELLTPRNTKKVLPGFTCEAREGKAGDWGRSGNSAAPVGFEDSLVVEDAQDRRAPRRISWEKCAKAQYWPLRVTSFVCE